MAITIHSINKEKMTTTLELSENHLEEYNKILYLLSWLQKTKTDIPQEFHDPCMHKIAFLFEKMLMGYLMENGFQAHDFSISGKRVYLNKDSSIDIYCQPININIKENNFPILSLEPHLNFSLNILEKRFLEARCCFRIGSAYCSFNLLINLTFLLGYLFDKNDEKNVPIIKPLSVKNDYPYPHIISFDQTKSFLKKMEEIMNKLGEDKIKYLSELVKRHSQELPDIYKETNIAFFCMNLLKILGKEEIINQIIKST